MTKLPDEIKVKVTIKVSRTLYDRIKAEATRQGLPGTIETTLETFCKQWFSEWERALDAHDAAHKSAGLVGVDGAPLGRA